MAAAVPFIALALTAASTAYTMANQPSAPSGTSVPSADQATGTENAASNAASAAAAQQASSAVGRDQLNNPSLGSLGVPQQQTGVPNNSLF